MYKSTVILAVSLSLAGCTDSTNNGGAGGEGTASRSAGNTKAASGSTTKASSATAANQSSNAQTSADTATVAVSSINASASAAVTSASVAVGTSANSTQGSTSTAVVAASSSTGMSSSVDLVACPAVVAATISTPNFAFAPASVTISVGDVIQFAPTGPHTMASDVVDLFDTVTAGLSACLRFNVAGSYPFHCTPHPFMTGTVTVQ